MVGRKQFDPDEALDAAVRAFWERGYSATSIGDLAEATGLSRASIYATFGDKQAFFLACLVRYTDRVGAAGRQALARSHTDVRAQVAAGFEAILSRLADPTQPAGCLLAQTAAESGALEEPVRVAVHRIVEEQVSEMRTLLASHAPPEVDESEIASLATYAVAVAQALAVMHRAGTPIDELRRTAEYAVQTLDQLTR